MAEFNETGLNGRTLVKSAAVDFVKEYWNHCVICGFQLNHYSSEQLSIAIGRKRSEKTQIFSACSLRSRWIQTDEHGFWKFTNRNERTSVWIIQCGVVLFCDF